MLIVQKGTRMILLPASVWLLNWKGENQDGRSKSLIPLNVHFYCRDQVWSLNLLGLFTDNVSDGDCSVVPATLHRPNVRWEFVSERVKKVNRARTGVFLVLIQCGRTTKPVKPLRTVNVSNNGSQE